jgi:hypothetical protein
MAARGQLQLTHESRQMSTTRCRAGSNSLETSNETSNNIELNEVYVSLPLPIPRIANVSVPLQRKKSTSHNVASWHKKDFYENDGYSCILKKKYL